MPLELCQQGMHGALSVWSTAVGGDKEEMLILMGMRRGGSLAGAADPPLVCLVRNLSQQQPAECPDFSWALEVVNVPALFI